MPPLGVGFRNRALRYAARVAIVLALLGTGCSRKSEQSAQSADAAPDTTATDSLETFYAEEPLMPEIFAEIDKPWTGDFNGMVERRLIRALVVYNKTGYFFDGLRPRGITYDALFEFEAALNKSLGTRHLKVQVVHIPVTRDRLLPMLEAGDGDIAVANLTITPGRLKDVAFSLPVMSGVSEVVVTHAGGPALDSLPDLAGREVWVRPSSSYHESLLELNQRFRQAGRDTVVIRAADEHLETEDLLEMTAAGLIDITIAESYLANFWGGVFDSLRVRDKIAVRTNGEIAWAFRKDSPLFEKQVNGFVRRHRMGNYLGNELFRRYMRSNKWAKNPTAGSERRRFAQTAEIFKKYGTKYDFDWLMLAAQAYQESGLNQRLVSPAGAVGVMQLLPSTAADRQVNIRGIDKIENNIHAGAKYMRYIHNNYCNDPGMDEMNRYLFAFACYNAGPNRVNGLRRKAKAAGLNPDIWFRNVEIVAAREIGRETVQYVSNIFKYYLAYKLALEKDLQAKTGAVAAR